MEKRDVGIAFVQAFILYSLLFFISCASQQTVEEAGEFEGDEVSVEAGADGFETATEDLEEEGEEQLGFLEDAKEGEEEELVSAADDELDNLEGELEQMDEEGEEGEKIAGLGEEDELEESVPAIDAAEPNLDGEGEEEAALADLLDEAPQEEATEELAVAPPVEPEPEPEMDIPAAPPIPRSIISRTPNIPAQAFDRNGSLMNRYYFVRQGDSWESVSKLIFGSPEKTQELKSWNSGSWFPGKVVYYNSTIQATDDQMRSFYNEREISPDTYVIQSGDWLSTIAEQKYGHIGSWRELAVVNNLDSPDNIARGQNLSFYPADLSAFPPPQAVASAKPMQEPPPTEPANAMEKSAPPAEEAPAIQKDPILNPGLEAGNGELPTDQKTAQAQMEQPTNNAAPPPSEVFAPPPVKSPPPQPTRSFSAPKKKSSGLSRLIQQNLFAFAVGGILLILLISLAVVNKRKRDAAQEEFADENFPTQIRARRR